MLIFRLEEARDRRFWGAEDMQISDEFGDIKDKCLDVWCRTSAESPALVTDIYRQIGPSAGPRMRMGFFDVRSDSSLEWRTHTIHEMESISAFVNSEIIFADDLFRNHPNQTYLIENMIPRVESVIALQKPSMAFVKYNINHTIIGFESLYIPQKSTAKPEWVMFISNIRFFIKEVELTKLDKMDAAIIQLLIEGDTAKEIAIRLETNYRTIEYRISRLKTMLNAKNTIQLVALLVGNQLSSLIADYGWKPEEQMVFPESDQQVQPFCSPD